MHVLLFEALLLLLFLLQMIPLSLRQRVWSGITVARSSDPVRAVSHLGVRPRPEPLNSMGLLRGKTSTRSFVEWISDRRELSPASEFMRDLKAAVPTVRNFAPLWLPTSLIL